jgi:uncharacterized protein YjbI with pentapeptide repeats
VSPQTSPTQEFTEENKALIAAENENCQFLGIDFSEVHLEDRSFDDCLFRSCRFDRGSLGGAIFSGCRFDQCQLTLMTLKHTTLADVEFTGCKLVGLNFSDCDDLRFSITLRETVLDSVVIFDRRMKGSKILSCRIRDCELSGNDLRNADFGGTVFERTNFSRCNLENADFTTCQGYLIDPSTNRLKNAKFSLPEAESFLGFLGIKLVR